MAKKLNKFKVIIFMVSRVPLFFFNVLISRWLIDLIRLSDKIYTSFFWSYKKKLQAR